MDNENKNDMNNLAVTYSRKSEEDKKKQVLSLDDQISECNRLIEDDELTLVAPHFKEEKSAKVAGKRVEFYKMLDLLKKGKARVVVCWAANRLARNLKDGAEIIDLVQNKGLRIVTPYTMYDSSNWFMLLIEFGMSTDFSLKLSKDVKRGLMSKVAKGLRPGTAPLGYLNVGEIKGEKSIVDDPERYDLCKKWWEMMLTGKYTVEESLAEITEMGLRDKKGGKISKTAAFRFFHNVFYTGHFYYSGAVHKGIHNAMITYEEYEKVQRIITGKYGGRYEDYDKREPLPLARAIKCAECGGTVTGDRKLKQYKNGTSHEFCYYRCKKNKGIKCTQHYLPAEQLEDQVKAYINNLELHPRFIDWVKGALRRRNQEEFEFERKRKEMLTKRLQELDKRKEVVYAMKIDGLYSEAEIKPKIAEILKEENEIKDQISSDRISYWGQVIDDTMSFATKIQELFNSKDPYVKRMVLQILGSDLRLKDKKLFIEAKSAFIFLRNKQNELFESNGLVGLKDGSIQQPKQANYTLPVSFGADSGN
ncbi:recombinase family protein [Candidatus Daviesbacteria bacterium]|nr:recombinase family protein [Candidatus Daviesbacteria bacterium]